MATRSRDSASNKPIAFSAYKSAQSDNVTGDSTIYGDGTSGSVICDSEIYDIGNNYSGTTGLFTAPITGEYHFDGHVFALGFSGQTLTQIRVVTTARAYAVQSYLIPTNVGVVISCDADMAAGETAYLQFQANGGAKIVDIYGAAPTPSLYTYWSGFYIGRP